MLSTALTAGAAATGARCAATGFWAATGAAGLGAAAAAGAAALATGAAVGAAVGAAAGAAAVGAEAVGAGGPPGGSVGNLIVGAAEGFGGRLIRTVSFLGCTFPVSFLGGGDPAGKFGMFSAINSI